MRTWFAVLSALYLLSAASGIGAAEPVPVAGCVERMDRIKYVSLRGLNPEAPALKPLVAEGTRNNACLLAALEDPTLIRNPFESPIMSQVARSELAPYLVTRVNALQRESCFPDSLVTAMSKDLFARNLRSASGRVGPASIGKGPAQPSGAMLMVATALETSW